MTYLVIGAGGVGGCIGGYLADAGFDVTLIARGRHLEAIHSRGCACIIRAAATSCASIQRRARPMNLPAVLM